MGVVAKEAGKSSIALALGLVAGTVNTVLVLPRAFEGAEEYWGLIRVLTAWSFIIAPVLGFGGTGIILRRSRIVEGRLRGALHASTAVIAAVSLAIWGGVLLFEGNEILSQFDAEKGGLLTGNLGLFFGMNALILMTNLSHILLTIQLKGSWSVWVTEVWLKVSYLVLAGCLLADWIDLNTMVLAYVGTWVVSMLAYILLLRKSQIPFHLKHLSQLDWKGNLNYGGYASLTTGAAVIATNLDFVMVGALLGLSVVPVYTMGFFIGSVVQMPVRALNTIFLGVLSSKVAELGPEGMQPFIQQYTRVALLLTATVFAGVLAGLRPLILALPEAYAGIGAVAIAIGLHRVILASSSSIGNIIGHTSHYRWNLPINIGMLITTVLTNWVCMSILGWGVTGAALATLFTGIWNSSWRIILLYRKVGIHPLSWSWLAIIGIASAVGATGYFAPNLWFGHGYIEAMLRGSVAAGAVLGIAYFSGLFPELKNAVKQRLGGLLK